MVKTLKTIEKVKCQKIDKFYFKSPEGRIYKYSSSDSVI